MWFDVEISNFGADNRLKMGFFCVSSYADRVFGKGLN
jgi:hypothetical protein